jgi:spore maturation protein CgeB
MYEPSWLRALREIGCDAEMFDCHAYTLPGLAGRMERRLLAGPGVLRLRRQLIRKVQDMRPDIVLLYQGHYIDLSTVQRLVSYSFVVGYHNDDPFGAQSNKLRYRHLRKALPAYHGYHVYRPVNVQEAINAGVRRVGLLMPAFVPWTDYPRTLSPERKEELGADVFFAGHCEPDARGACLLAAINAGLKVRIHGDQTSWRMFAPAELLSRIGRIRHITGERYREAISAARIAVCFLSKWNRDQYTRRVFEITACGGFLLCERTAAMVELFAEGDSAEYFSSQEEFIDKARFYVSHEESRKRIAARGLEQVRTGGHDLLSRMRQWLAEIDEWRQELNDATKC